MKMTRQSPVISVRVTDEELEMLEALIAREKARMEAAGFPPTVTASGLFRLWLRERAKAAGIKPGITAFLEPESQPLFPPEVPQPEAVPAPAPAAPVESIPVPVVAAAPVEVPVDDLKTRVTRALETKVFPSQNALARAAGVDSGSLSRWMQGKAGIGPEKRTALDKLLKEHDV